MADDSSCSLRGVVQKKSWKRLEPFDPRSPFIRHFKAMSLIFLSITFFRLPVSPRPSAAPHAPYHHPGDVPQHPNP